MKQAVNSGQTVTDRTHRERSPQSQKKQFLLDRHVPFCALYFSTSSHIDINIDRCFDIQLVITHCDVTAELQQF